MLHCLPLIRPVRDGDIIFVRMGLLEEFARNVVPSFNRTRFVLVTHSGDEFAPSGVKSVQLRAHLDYVTQPCYVRHMTI